MFLISFRTNDGKLQSNNGINCLDECLDELSWSMTNKVANSTVYMIGKINRYDCEKYS